MSNSQTTASLLKRQRCSAWEGSLASPKGVGHAWRGQTPSSRGCKSCVQHSRMQMGSWMGPARSRVPWKNSLSWISIPSSQPCTPVHCTSSPLPRPPLHLMVLAWTGYHTLAHHCLNNSELKPSLKLTKASSISSHALKNQKSFEKLLRSLLY